MRYLLLLLVAVLAALVPGLAAHGAETDGIRIREAALDKDGATKLTVSVAEEHAGSGVLDGDDFAVTEAGERIADITAEPLLGSQSEAVFVTLAVDVSRSTRGEPIVRAREAAKRFVEHVTGEGVAVALLAFSGDVRMHQSFTSDAGRLTEAIDALQPLGGTALYDAIGQAASGLTNVVGQRNIVVFSDGADTASGTTLSDAIAAATDARAPVTTVALAGGDLDEASLQDIAARTGGGTVAVSDVAGLEASFRAVAEELTSQYVVTYRSTRTQPREMDLAVSLADGSASDQIAVVNNRRPVAAELPAVTAPQPLVAELADGNGLYIAAGAGFLALLLLFGIALQAPLKRRSNRVMQRSVRFFTERKDRDDTAPAAASASDIARLAVQFADRIPKPEGFEEKLQSELDRAAWPMRANEFLLLSALTGLAGGLFGFAITGHPIFSALFIGVGAAAPRVVLSNRVKKRTSLFVQQLPDTLQLLAGSLRAGHGLLQAVDTVVQEAADPTASEFSRVLTEARLGMPLEEALEGMADRLQSPDFRWVALAINIQRQVGGNLAELLDTVSNTLRDRDSLRRHVKALTAEGRLSAVVLTALPFLIVGYMFLINPEYIILLFTDPRGIMMVALALGMMGVGALWLRKLIRIKV